MTSPLFTRDELLALDPADLAELIGAASGEDLAVRCATLGLDLEIPDDRAAVERAMLPVFGPMFMDGGKPVDELGASPDELPSLDEMLDAYAGRPDPVLAGTFALYVTARRDVVLVTEIPGRGVERRALPAALVQAGVALASGKKVGALGALFGRRRRSRDG